VTTTSHFRPLYGPAVSADLVLLVGMMGTGKSSVGQVLAQLLQATYVDNDEVVVRRTGRTVAEILTTSGEDELRAAERAALAEALAVPRPSVVSVAGGLVLAATDRAVLMGAGGVIVWLRAAPATLAARVEGTDRPWIGADPLASLAALAEQRDPLYAEVANLVVDVDDRGPAEVAAVVAARLTTATGAPG
jgi:shikimate kinase